AAYQPYADAFAPVAQAPVGQAAEIDAKATAPEGVVLGVGPTNMAGQGYEWARAVEGKLAGVRAETFTLSSGNTFGFAADRSISTDDWLSRHWQLAQVAYVLDHYSHVLAECAMPPFGRLNGPWANFDLAELDTAGIAVALAFHGSEIRDPAAQRARVPFSPFDPDHEMTRALQSKVDRLGPVVRAMDVPKFVSTPDLLHDVPDATWLPVVVDPDLWATESKPLQRERPVVVHAPSSPFTKGTGLIEPVVEQMHDDGLIEYRRIKGVQASEMPALLADADIVLDQFVFGSYGVMSVQAMAAGRVTVCYLHDSVTEHLPADVPIVNADPDTLGAELERILAERDEAGRLAARGPAYVRENHDGTRSARVLADFLGVTP
ncbi:MAG: glycosyl transferase family 1, partial [Streptomycetaceae bacterium]|nr:glycosyl transferase family 1 [Streptomycetaceae bacterium]